LKDILARAQRGTLARFAGSNVLLAFDYDGTLAPIVADPERATMRRSTHGLLNRLARIYPCVIISGRSRRDVRRLLEDARVAQVVGNHGIEPHRPTAEYRTLVRRWRAILCQRLQGLPGVTVEDKGLSISVHYRSSPRKMSSRDAVLRAVAGLHRARVFGGKDVVNVVPRTAPHKGTALETERLRLGCVKAIYVGDDETDEDAFSLRHPGRFLSIRVGRKRGSRADHCIRSQAYIDALLQALLALRDRPAGAGSPPPQRRRRVRRLLSGSTSKKGASIRLAAVS
jgi:trehalose 6-phosphate phosphatase